MKFSVSQFNLLTPNLTVPYIVSALKMKFALDTRECLFTIFHFIM